MTNLSKQLYLLFFLLLSFSCRGQIVEDPTTWKYEVVHEKDNNYALTFQLKLKSGWHIWSLHPGGDGLQMPPAFTFDKNSSVKLKGKITEKGKAITGAMDGVDGIVTYYHDGVDYTQHVTVTANTTVKGQLEYQVCNDQMCLPPKSKSFSFDIKDVAGATITDAATTTDIAEDTNITMVATTATPDSTIIAATATTSMTDIPKDTTTAEAPKKAASNLIMFTTGLGNGLVSVITPCVFAMLPMTVSFFLKRSKDRKTGIKVSLQYSLSIVFIFTFIGGLISAFFGPDALHAFSTNWIVNVVFFIIFVIFGISFLGAFEINLPSSWATKLDSKANTQSFVGIFFMALTLVIVSFSCTVPFIGNLVVAIQGGSKIGPLLGFFGFGVGLALPFTLFAIFPGLLKELGKSGGWLNAVKVTFGFVELALAMKFLSNADLSQGWRLLDREIFLSIWIGLSFGLALYLFGFIRFSHDSGLPKSEQWDLPYLTVPRLLFALSSFIFGIYLIPGLWGAPLNGVGAFVPPMGTQEFVLSSGGSAFAEAPIADNGIHPVQYVTQMKKFEPPTVVKFHLETYFNYEEALAAAKKLKKPILLDFTGINCANCRKFEAEVWSKPEVIKIMKNDFIVASLFCDASAVMIPETEQHYSKSVQTDIKSLADKNVELQVDKFQSNTQPYYYFVDEDGVKLADKGVSYPTAPEDFITHLEKVKAKYKELHPQQ